MLKKILLSISFAVLSILVFWGLSRSESLQLLGTVHSHIATDQKIVALTFDDGPTPEYTQAIVNILQEQDVRATFFLVGEAIEQYPMEARRIVEAEHEIANHSYTHNRMVFIGDSRIATEIEKTDALIQGAGFPGQPYFRPPYGLKFFMLPRYLSAHGRTTIMWDVARDSDLDRDASAQSLVEHTINNVRPGSIILMHVMFKSRERSMDAIAPMIEALRREGYEFVTVSELLSRGAA